MAREATLRDFDQVTTRLCADDPHVQLRSLYLQLLESQDCFDEFKQTLSTYPIPNSQEQRESPEARSVRQQLNDRIRA
ncbi:MAG: hypothetical protein AAGA56_19725 [Myxococcota bacterium]